MVSASYVESLVSSAKRLRISAPRTSTNPPVHQYRLQSQVAASIQQQHKTQTGPRSSQPTRAASQLATQSNPPLEEELRNLRLPKAVQAVFLTPLKRTPTHGIPVCNLQIRSYSVRNLEIFADFCLRAAYYLNLPAKGPVPLPRITERWTVPRSNFIFKKSQENFERITMRRLIQIQDGHLETVALWLAYIQKHRYYGVGLKANVFEQGRLDVVEDLEEEGKKIQDVVGESALELFGTKSNTKMSEEDMNKVIHDEPFKASWGAYAGLAGTPSVSAVSERFDLEKVDIDEVDGVSDDSGLKMQYPALRGRGSQRGSKGSPR